MTVVTSGNVLRFTGELPGDRLNTKVTALLRQLYPQSVHGERRRDERFPYAQLLYLTPTADDGQSPGGPPIVVSGKHLSSGGLGFYHQHPLLQRRMIASLEEPNGDWLGFLIDLTWCKFNKQGWYESGGRFLELLPSPVTRESLARRRA